MPALRTFRAISVCVIFQAATVKLLVAQTEYSLTTHVPLRNYQVQSGNFEDFDADGTPVDLQSAMLVTGEFDVPRVSNVQIEEVFISLEMQLGGVAWSGSPAVTSSLSYGVQVDGILSDGQNLGGDPGVPLGKTATYTDSSNIYEAGWMHNFATVPPGTDGFTPTYVIDASSFVEAAGSFGTHGSGAAGSFAWMQIPTLEVTYDYFLLPNGATPFLPGQGGVEVERYVTSNPSNAGLFPQGFLPPYITDTPGDVNNDRIVNGQDLAQISSNWLQKGPNVTGDLNGDGIVNAQDLAMVSSNWLGVPTDTMSSSATVPEPSTFILGGLALLAMRRCRQ